MSSRGRALPLVLGAALALSPLVACGSSSEAGPSPGGPFRIEASFYPLQWVAEQVGGPRVTVANLTPPGAEPHDLELNPRDTAALADADLVVFLSGFQPAVDDALETVDTPTIDAADHVDLDLAAAHGEHGEDPGPDPHFWLDPTRLAEVATAFGDAMVGLDPDHAEGYRTRVARTVASLEDLDGDLEAGLADCEQRDLVTSHEAFGYLARRYDLTQVGVSGVSPDEEPSASDLASVIDFVSRHDVRTIYFEPLVSPDVAQTVADETGARTAVLDPLEGLSDASEGDDYLEVMRANLATLRAGQGCS